MRTTDIIHRLEKAQFTKEQIEALIGIFEERDKDIATNEYVRFLSEENKIHVDLSVTKAKYELVKWIVGGVIANGLIATILKYVG
jgi:hypothetical protein